MNKKDSNYMQQACKLAHNGIGRVNPNPLVGAIIVKNDLIISTGYHASYGSAHAELNAIQAASDSLAGATLYCNLEPCCHYNKQTPPCTQRIIAERFARVVIANRDPNPLVNGKGIAMLRAAGITVTEGVYAEQAASLNEIFFNYMKRNSPFIHLKWAQTLDGNIATTDGTSQWISHLEARKKVHQLRNTYGAILVGQNTLIKDNPRLTIRIDGQEERSSWRVVLASLAFIDSNMHIINDQFSNKTIIFTTRNDVTMHPKKVDLLAKRKVNIEMISQNKKGYLDLEELIERLSAYNITSLLVEGGGALHSSFFEQNHWDRISIFIAPLLLGKGIKVLDQISMQTLQQAQRISTMQYELLGDTLHYQFDNSTKKRGSLCSLD